MQLNGTQPILPFVLVSGLLDSLNPCAIAVLLIFIALMFTLRRARLAVLGMGLIYVAAVYLTYLAIGLGIIRVINLFGVPHLLSQIGAWVVILIGVRGLYEYFFPGKFQILTIGLKSRQIIAHWATKATISAVILAGVFVGIFEFPCSGAIYFATLGLLAAKATFAKGLAYLILYNLMFVLPLIIILLVATNRMVTEKLLNLDEANSSKLRLASALIMIGLGAVILIWFT